ncbi:MAG: hypothetical protein VKI81_09190 [Synechococcaceae cyanobacterium]|nr:hypothetical protein [Synechococcaceae cyanobacterium]
MFSSPRGLRRLGPLALAALALLPFTAPARAQSSDPTGTVRQDPFSTKPGVKEESILDSANPLELMNRIRRNAAMEDATPPGTAVDDALREFEARSAPASPPSSGPGSTLQGP